MFYGSIHSALFVCDLIIEQMWQATLLYVSYCRVFTHKICFYVRLLNSWMGTDLNCHNFPFVFRSVIWQRSKKNRNFDHEWYLEITLFYPSGVPNGGGVWVLITNSSPPPPPHPPPPHPYPPPPHPPSAAYMRQWIGSALVQSDNGLSLWLGAESV